MLKDRKILVIIPARGGSKKIPRKNIKFLAGKPLIAYSIEQAKQLGLIDKIIVSTEDIEIAKIAERYGVEVQMRPGELAQDNTPMIPVLQHVVKTLEQNNQFFDIVILLQPTNPFRKTKHILSTIEKIDEGFDSATTVSKLNIHPCRFLKINEKGTSIFLNDEQETLRQETNNFHVNGAVYAYKKEVLMNLQILSWQKTNNAAVEIDEKYAFDIDNPLDFEIAEYLMQQKNQIVLGEKIIEKDSPIFIIAEAGVNHNGSMEIAKKLIDVACEAKVDAIKFQTFNPDDLVTEDATMCSYQEKNIGEKDSQLSMLKKINLDYECFKELKKYCDEKKILFLSTPHTEDAIDFLNDLVPAFKIGSGDLTNLPFLKKISRIGKPMILGTGMSTIEEVKEALKTINNEGNEKVIMLHCTTNYPCSLNEVNLRAMQTMQNELECLVGYSDHTEGIRVPLIAQELGAVIIEKHFTLDKNMVGPDHKVSLEPEELKRMVELLRDNQKKIEFEKLIMGNPEKKPSNNELEIMKVVRKIIVAKKDIPKDKGIEEEDLIIKRPGTGILPGKIGEVIGKIAKRNIKANSLISHYDLF